MTYRIAVVQAEPRWQADDQGLFSRAFELINEAAEAGVSLVVLPALFGWARVGPMVDLPLELPYDLGVLPSGTRGSDRDATWRQAAVAALAVYQQIARDSGVWLVGGSLPQLDEGGSLYNASPVFAPDGRVCGWQRQTHLSAAERAWGLSRDDELSVIETDVGRLGILLCEDVLYPEVSRILCLLGANILIHQGAWRTTSQSRRMSRLWREVQANQVFGLESVLAGGPYRARATVHAPCEMTEDQRGVLAQAKTDDGDKVVMADLDLEALQAVIDEYPIYDMLNEEMYRRYFPSLYESRGQG